MSEYDRLLTAAQERLSIDLASPLEAARQDGLPEKPFVTLTEALTWIAFGVALDTSDFGIADQYGIGPFADKSHLRDCLGSALSRFSEKGRGGLLEVSGRYVASYGDHNGAANADTQYLQKSQLRDFGRYDSLYSGLERGTALNWESEPIDRILYAKGDGWRDVEVSRESLEREFLNTPLQSSLATAMVFPSQGGQIYDWPVCEVIEYVRNVICDNNEHDCYPATCVAVRQAALDGKIAIYGKKELRPPHRPGFQSEVWTKIDGSYWQNFRLNSMVAGPMWSNHDHTWREPYIPSGYQERYWSLLLNREEVERVWHSQAANLFSQSAGAETECKTWLKSAFDADLHKRRSKTSFQNQAIKEFAGRLSRRSFLRAWARASRRLTLVGCSSWLIWRQPCWKSC